jgi:hypothetical protein
LFLRTQRSKLGFGLGVLGTDLESFTISDGRAGAVAGMLEHHAEVVAEVGVVRLEVDGRLEGAFGLGVETLLAIGDPQQGLGVCILVVRHHGARQQVDGFIEVLVAQGRHALVAKGGGR